MERNLLREGVSVYTRMEDSPNPKWVHQYQSLVLLLPIFMNDDHEVIAFCSNCFQTLNVGFVVEDPRAGGHYERLSSLDQLKHRTS